MGGLGPWRGLMGKCEGHGAGSICKELALLGELVPGECQVEGVLPVLVEHFQLFLAAFGEVEVLRTVQIRGRESVVWRGWWGISGRLHHRGGWW